VERACDAENARVLNVGVASHNLFDLAFALVCAPRLGAAPT
jgi:proline dehydrogenase